jgi:hypothetical protein
MPYLCIGPLKHLYQTKATQTTIFSRKQNAICESNKNINKYEVMMLLI